MSSTNRKGKGNLLITYLFKSSDVIEQIHEEMELKNEIAKLLSSKGYKFTIADDSLIKEGICQAN